VLKLLPVAQALAQASIALAHAISGARPAGRFRSNTYTAFSVAKRRPDGYRDWKKEYSTEDHFRIKIGLIFCYFFYQEKK